MESSSLAPRVDAQASDERTGVGGWCPVLDESGVPAPFKSRWFSMEIDRKNFPWVFSRDGRSSRVIATLFYWHSSCFTTPVFQKFARKFNYSLLGLITEEMALPSTNLRVLSILSMQFSWSLRSNVNITYCPSCQLGSPPFQP